MSAYQHDENKENAMTNGRNESFTIVPSFMLYWYWYANSAMVELARVAKGD